MLSVPKIMHFHGRGIGFFVFENAAARRCEATGFDKDFLGTDMDTVDRKHFVKYFHSNKELRWFFSDF